MLPLVHPNLTGSLNLNCLCLGCPCSPPSPASNSEARTAATTSEANTRLLFILEMFRFSQLSCSMLSQML